MLDITRYYTQRELFGLAFMVYVNYAMTRYAVEGNPHQAVEIINRTGIYTCIDAIWLYLGTATASRVPKKELYLHHAMTLLLILSHTPANQKIGMLVIECTTLLLMLMRLPFPSGVRKVMKNVLAVLWLSLRIFWLPIQLYYIKYRDYYGPRVISNAAYVYFSVLYLLNIKWTCSWLKMNKYPDHYSSVALSLPLLAVKNIPIDTAVACCLLTYTSYGNHLVNTRETISADHGAIVYTCLIYMDMGTYSSLALALLACWRKYSYDESLGTNIVFVSSLGYFCYEVPGVLNMTPLIAYGYYLLCTQRNPLIWHVVNSLWICLVTAHKYGWESQNSAQISSGIS